MLAGAHVPDRARLLAVAGEPGGSQLVERHLLRAAGQERLADIGPAVQSLDRPDVEVLARVAAGHDRELRRFELERLDSTGLDERHQPERLDARSEVDDVVRIAEPAEQASVDVDLHDVAAVDALLDAVPDLADKDGRGRAPGSRAVGGCSCGHDVANLLPDRPEDAPAPEPPNGARAARPRRSRTTLRGHPLRRPSGLGQTAPRNGSDA